jgi:hypothetical protein
MQLHELQYLPPVTLSASQTVYRVQRIKARPGAVTTGPLKTAPIGDMSGRFALTGAATGYFAESPETAVYESLVRREAVLLSISNAASRQLLAGGHQTKQLQGALQLRAIHLAYTLPGPRQHGCLVLSWVGPKPAAL